MTILRAVAALALALIATPVSAQTVVKTDHQWTSEGEYLAFASPWCAQYHGEPLVEGRDYANSVSYKKGDLATAKDVKLTWRYPANKPTKCGVYGFNQVAQWNYDGGAVYKPRAPVQVGQIKELTIGYGVDFSAPQDSFNGLGEFYLTTKPGDLSTKVIEIGWFWNAPPSTVTWAANSRKLGVFKDKYSKLWTVALDYSGVAGKFVTFIPTNGRLSWGNFDATNALAYLQAAGVVKAEWYFNGYGVGVEPLKGSGIATIRNAHATLK
jgi:hypothetical protein